MKFTLAVILVLLCVSCSSMPRAGASQFIVNGTTGERVSLENVVQSVPAVAIAVVSEVHDYAPHHYNQVEFLKALASARQQISVGFEFFEQQYQNLVDQFVSGVLAEKEFLSRINWGKIPFDFYRAQALFPREHGGRTLALNASWNFVARVTQVGIDGLAPGEKKYLPPGFQLGNEKYFERFKEVMADHVPPQALQRYFEGQSVWDETMAYNACRFSDANPNGVLMILVGDFHAEYGGGLPARIRARCAHPVTVISQIDATDMNEKQISEEVSPSPKYGPRGDFVWVTSSKSMKY